MPPHPPDGESQYVALTVEVVFFTEMSVNALPQLKLQDFPHRDDSHPAQAAGQSLC